jgi:hypothetical protein
MRRAPDRGEPAALLFSGLPTSGTRNGLVRRAAD